MKIKIEIDVFDDPEYCGKEDCCSYLGVNFIEDDICELFFVGLKTNGDFDNPITIPLKCDQCKEAFQKANQKTKALTWICDGHGDCGSPCELIDHSGQLYRNDIACTDKTSPKIPNWQQK